MTCNQQNNESLHRLTHNPIALIAYRSATKMLVDMYFCGLINCIYFTLPTRIFSLNCKWYTNRNFESRSYQHPAIGYCKEINFYIYENVTKICVAFELKLDKGLNCICIIFCLWNDSYEEDEGRLLFSVSVCGLHYSSNACDWRPLPSVEMSDAVKCLCILQLSLITQMVEHTNLCTASLAQWYFAELCDFFK